MPPGPKPISAKMRAIMGTNRTTRHGHESDMRVMAEAAARTFGAPQCPDYLKGEAPAAWDRFIKPAYWLDGSREAAAVAFCTLWAEFLASPMTFVAAKHAQMRGYMAVLGLTDERNRHAVPEQPDDPDGFFN